MTALLKSRPARKRAFTPKHPAKRNVGTRKRAKREEQNRLHIPAVRLLRQILRPETVVVHIPNGGWRSRVEAAILKAMGVIAGIPDILIIHEGHAFFLEFKAEEGRLSDAQIETTDLLLAAGAPVGVARNFEEVIALLDEWKIPHLRMKMFGAFEAQIDRSEAK